MMHERCLMLRPRTQTSSPPAGRAEGTPCTTSCRAPPTPRDERCPSPFLCPSCTSMQEEEMETTPRTARARRPRLRGSRNRGTANLLRAPAGGRGVVGWIPALAAVVKKPFLQSGQVAGG